MNQPIQSWTVSSPVRFITESTWRYWFIVAVVFAFSRLATWGYPFDSDHWIFFYVGNEWIAQSGQLYVDAWDHKPPLIFLVNGFMAVLFGENIYLHRVWLTALALIDTFLFYKVSQKIVPTLLARVNSTLNPQTAVKLTLLLYVFLRNLSQFAVNGNTTENIGLIFLLAMILGYLMFSQSGNNWWMFLSGFFAANIFWLKGNLILLAGVIGLVLIIHLWGQTKNLFKSIFAFISPILIVSIFWVIYFLAQGTFEDFIIGSFTFSAKYASSAWAGQVSSNILLLLTTLALLGPALIFFAFFMKDVRKQLSSESFQIVTFSFLVGLVLIGAVGSFYSYYLLIIMPFIIIIVMYVFFRFESLKKVWKIVLTLILISTVVVNTAISLRFLANNFYGNTQQEALDYNQAAEFIRENSEPSDTLFTYDYGATFYQLSGRESASRFISASHLLLDYRDGFGFGFNDIFIEEMEDNNARFVILNDASRDLYLSNKPLEEYILNNFEPLAKFGAIEVLQRIQKN